VKYDSVLLAHSISEIDICTDLIVDYEHILILHCKQAF
jgi:hypothetical protein